jgi:hypothetical protein
MDLAVGPAGLLLDALLARAPRRDGRDARPETPAGPPPRATSPASQRQWVPPPEAYEVGPDGDLRFTKAHQEKVCRNYEDLMQSQNEVSALLAAGDTGVFAGSKRLPPRSAGPLGAMLTGAAAPLTLLSLAPPPKGCKFGPR